MLKTIAVAMLLAAAVVLAAGEFPLQIHLNGGMAAFKNTGTKTITAWAARADGWPFDLVTHTFLPAGQQIDLAWLQGQRVVAVAFADGTALGDENSIGDIFIDRQGATVEYRRLLAMLQSWPDEDFQARLMQYLEKESAVPLAPGPASRGAARAQSHLLGFLENPRTSPIVFPVRTRAEILEELERLAATSALSERRTR
jgi:hypothetical protein